MKAFWDRTENFGDKLGPWLMRQITGQQPEFSTGADEPVHLTCGSILNIPIQGSVVWGSGFARCADPVVNHGRICAVRGPRSREKLLAYGVECPDVCGDPAVLLPRFLKGAPSKTHEIAIIPHYADHADVLAAYGSIPSVRVVNLLDSVEEVVRQITECERAISSSLHGLITAHAYGIPCQWVRFSDRVEGCGFKFHDYLASGGLPLVNPLELVPIFFDIRAIIPSISSRLPEIDTEALWQACPFKNP